MSKKILLVKLPQCELGQNFLGARVGYDVWQHMLELERADPEVETLDAESLGLNFFAILRAIRRCAPQFVVFHHRLVRESGSHLAVDGFAGLLVRHLQQWMPQLQVTLLP